jgi:hypothetical protein
MEVSSMAPALAGIVVIFFVVPKLLYGDDRVSLLACAGLSLDLILYLKLESIPTLGFSGPLSYYYSAFKYTGNARAIIREGYKKVCSAYYYNIPSLSQNCSIKVVFSRLQHWRGGVL